MERVHTQTIVAETSDHAREKVEEQERLIAPMRTGDPRLPKAMVILRTLRENLAAAEFNEMFDVQGNRGRL